MAKRRPRGPKPVEDAHGSAPLPTGMAGFARLVRAARTEEAVGALVTMVEEEWARAARARGSRAEKAEHGRRHESRLMGIVATLAEDPRRFTWSHETAGAGLVHARSRKFAAMLRRLAGRPGEDPVAAEFLAWIGFAEDHGRVLKLLRSKDWAVRKHAALGLRFGRHHGYVSKAAGKRFARVLLATACGEEEIPPGEQAEEALSEIVEAAESLGGPAARAVLRSPRALHAGNPAAGFVLLRGAPRAYRSSPAAPCGAILRRPGASAANTSGKCELECAPMISFDSVSVRRGWMPSSSFRGYAVGFHLEWRDGHQPVGGGKASPACERPKAIA